MRAECVISLLLFGACNLVSTAPSDNHLKELLEELLEQKEVRSLLNELGSQDETEDEIDREVGHTFSDVMKKRENLATSRLAARTVEDGDICESGGVTTCLHKLCDEEYSEKCTLGCDNKGYPGPEGTEHYFCNCETEHVGPFCNISQSEVCKPGKPGNKNECFRCYPTIAMYSGFFCYDKDWLLLNSQAKILRSLETDKITNFLRATRELLKN